MFEWVILRVDLLMIAVLFTFMIDWLSCCFERNSLIYCFAYRCSQLVGCAGFWRAHLDFSGFVRSVTLAFVCFDMRCFVLIYFVVCLRLG